MPVASIKDKPKELNDLSQRIFVYFRSHNTAQILVDLGYTNIVDIGGILNWTRDIEK